MFIIFKILFPLAFLAACVEPSTTPLAAPPLVARPSVLPPETDLPPLDEGHWTLACDAELQLIPGGRLTLQDPDGERLLAREAVGLPAISQDGLRLAWSHAPVARPDMVISVAACEAERFGQERILVDGPGSPDRPAISPEGDLVAWFSGATGIASLWTASFNGGPRVQRTNIGLERLKRRPGHAPEGFVAPPRRGAPLFQRRSTGSLVLTWDSPSGLETLELR